MANVLTTASTISCPDKGTVTLSSDAKLLVAGNPVLLEAQVLGSEVKGCKQTNANSAEKPCLTVTKIAKGAAAKLLVGGSKVLHQGLEGTTEGVPNNTLSASDGAVKLQAD
jgi:hypothetical protein